MNRQLKFRIWDKTEKEFTNVSPSFVCGSEEKVFEFCGSLYQRKNWVIQQFTGLYDKNKKPIYEGDIIKYTRLIEKERRIVELFSFIKFQDAKFGFDLTGFNDMFYDLSDEPDFEVVGNIFEHSELLK